MYNSPLVYCDSRNDVYAAYLYLFHQVYTSTKDVLTSLLDTKGVTLCVEHILIQAYNIRLSEREVKVLQDLGEVKAKATRN
jgi:hypothetical protein